MAMQRFQVGDTVEVTHYTPVRHPPNFKDEMGTEALFQRIVGKRFRIMGFDEYGHIELHPTRHDAIWIESGDVSLVSKAIPRRQKKGDRQAGLRK